MLLPFITVHCFTALYPFILIFWSQEIDRTPFWKWFGTAELPFPLKETLAGEVWSSSYILQVAHAELHTALCACEQRQHIRAYLAPSNCTFKLQQYAEVWEEGYIQQEEEICSFSDATRTKRKMAAGLTCLASQQITLLCFTRSENYEWLFLLTQAEINEALFHMGLIF